MGSTGLQMALVNVLRTVKFAAVPVPALDNNVFVSGNFRKLTLQVCGTRSPADRWVSDVSQLDRLVNGPYRAKSDAFV